MTGMMLEWMRLHQDLLQWMGAASLVTVLATPLIVSLLVIRIPEDYFLNGRDHYREMWKEYHPFARFLALSLKNAAGAVFVLAGLAMLVLPGQGVITILIGLTLVDFPGKRGLELKLVRQKKVLSAVNWMRRRAGKPPLKVPDRG